MSHEGKGITQVLFSFQTNSGAKNERGQDLIAAYLGSGRSQKSLMNFF